MPVSKKDVIIVDREFEAKTAEDVFYKYKAEIIADLNANLIAKDKDQPGRLIQSIDVDITVGNQLISFALKMEDYWKFVDAGVDGTKTKHGSPYSFKDGNKPVNLGAMLDFIKVRGIKPKQTKVNAKRIKRVRNKTIKKAVKQIGRDKALKQAAFAMGIHVKRHGIKPTHFFTDVINDDLKKRLTADLSKALARDIEIDFKKSLHGN